MDQKVGSRAPVAILLVAASLFLGGCGTETKEIVVNEVHWKVALSICTGRGRPVRACAIKDGPICIVIVPAGDPKAREHELLHCRDGKYHL